MAAILLLVLAFIPFHFLIAILLIKLLSPPKSPAASGPRSLPLIGCLLPFYRNRRRLLHWYTDLLAASPSNTITLSRLGARRTIVTANPSNVEHILSANFPNYPKGKPFTDILGDLLGGGIFNADGHRWLSQRRAASHAFTLRALRGLIARVLVPDIADHLLPALVADGKTVVDLQEVLRGFSFCVISHVFLGPFAAHLELAEALDVASAISAGRGSAPLALLWKAKRAVGCGSERRLREAVDRIHGFVMDIIRKNREKNDFLTDLTDIIRKNREKNDLSSDLTDIIRKNREKNDLSTDIIRKNREKNDLLTDLTDIIRKNREKNDLSIDSTDFIRKNREKNDLSSDLTDIIRKNREKNDLSTDLLVAKGSQEEDEEIRDMAISLLMAGRDTTSSALTWFFWLVSTHAAVEENIINEIMAIGSEDEEMSYERLKEMKYLEASLMESMRLYPPVAWDSKHAAGDDVLPDGTRIRKGDRVTYFPFGMGRMQGIWGSDWRDFRPERWVAEGGRAVVRVSPYKFPVFQAGPRVCLGREMAMIQMKFVAAAVLRRFELRWVGTRAPEMVPLLTAHMAEGLPVVVVKRAVPAKKSVVSLDCN